jgi:hypothetical protein
MPRFSAMTPGAATYDHATAVADILAGYHRFELAAYRDERRTPELKRLQDSRHREDERLVDPERPN